MDIEIACGVITLPYLWYQSRTKVIVKGARLESRGGFQVSTCLHYCQLAPGSLASSNVAAAQYSQLRLLRFCFAIAVFSDTRSDVSHLVYSIIVGPWAICLRCFKMGATPPERYTQEMLLILLALLVLFVAFRFCFHISTTSQSNKHQQDTFHDGSVGYGSHQAHIRAPSLYCETCYTNKDVDWNGWCHKCERMFPFMSLWI